MEYFIVYYAYPSSHNNDGWSELYQQVEIEAENQDAANAIMQKKINDGEYDAYLALPNQNDMTIRPYVPEDNDKIRADRKIDEDNMK